MNVDIKNNVETLETTLDVKLTKEEFAPFLDEAFKKEVKKVKADGFRVGKMPKAIYIKKYGIESLFNEAINLAIARTYSDAIIEHKVEGVAFPKIDVSDVSEDKLHFSAVVAIAPTIKEVDESKINVKQPTFEVTSEEVDEQIAKLLDSETELVVSDTEAQNGDTVVIDFKGFVDGEAFDGGESNEYPLVLGSNSFIPGFEEQLIGTKAGQKIDVVVTFPKDYQSAELAGKEATFECVIHEVKVKQEPVLNDEFVANLGLENVNNVQELKKQKENELKAQKESNKEAALREAAINAIDEYSKELDLFIHTDHIEEEIKAIISNFEKQNQIEFAQYAQMINKTQEEVKEEIKETAIESIKRKTIIDSLAKKHGVSVTDEDVENELQKLANMYQVDIEVIKQSVESELSQIRSMIKDQKILDKLSA